MRIDPKTKPRRAKKGANRSATSGSKMCKIRLIQSKGPSRRKYKDSTLMRNQQKDKGPNTERARKMQITTKGGALARIPIVQKNRELPEHEAKQIKKEPNDTSYVANPNELRYAHTPLKNIKKKRDPPD